MFEVAVGRATGLLARFCCCCNSGVGENAASTRPGRFQNFALISAADAVELSLGSAQSSVGPTGHASNSGRGVQGLEWAVPPMAVLMTPTGMWSW